MKETNVNFYEVDIPSDGGVYSMVIKATHSPTYEELQSFLKADIDMYDGKEAILVCEISETEARCFYDFDNESNWPVLN